MENTGFATISVGGMSSLYEINLLTGSAERIGAIREPMIDLAIPLYQ